jgi:uncharacterized protein (UPF0332 family)
MFDWSTYLELATQLAQQEHEQHARTAISRAYYAAFHHAKRFIESTRNATIPADGRAHEAVPSELLRMSKQYVLPANKLLELKSLRTWADYRGGAKANLAAEVEKALAHARTIIDRLK